MIDCVKNILESIGKGDCKACICDVIPQFCQEKKYLAAVAKSEAEANSETEKEPQLSCNFCTGAVLGKPQLKKLTKFCLPHFCLLLGAVETCIHTGTAEDVIGCVINILQSSGQGECKACICDIIPQFCQEKKIVPTEAKSENKSGAKDIFETEKEPQLSCNFLTCPAAILGKLSIKTSLFSFNSVFLRSS